MKSSWKTTTAGILGIATIIVHNWAPQYANTLDSIFGIAVSLGLVAARDNNVSSEDVGAK